MVGHKQLVHSEQFGLDPVPEMDGPRCLKPLLQPTCALHVCPTQVGCSRRFRSFTSVLPAGLLASMRAIGEHYLSPSLSYQQGSMYGSDFKVARDARC